MKLVGTLALLASLTACASTHAINPAVASVSFERAQDVEVKLVNFEFRPATIRLEAGKPYALRLTNAESGGHDFTAPEFFAAARIAPEDVDSVRDGQVELAGGVSATIHLVPSAGTFNLVCTHAGHVLLGMKGKIIVS